MKSKTWTGTDQVHWDLLTKRNRGERCLYGRESAEWIGNCQTSWQQWAGWGDHQRELEPSCVNWLDDLTALWSVLHSVIARNGVYRLSNLALLSFTLFHCMINHSRNCWLRIWVRRQFSQIVLVFLVLIVPQASLCRHCIICSLPMCPWQKEPWDHRGALQKKFWWMFLMANIWMSPKVSSTRSRAFGEEVNHEWY